MQKRDGWNNKQTDYDRFFNNRTAVVFNRIESNGISIHRERFKKHFYDESERAMADLTCGFFEMSSNLKSLSFKYPDLWVTVYMINAISMKSNS